MGQTLTHGIYLPDEGERNCYSGLAANWQLLDGAVGTIAEHTTQIAGKAPAVHTHTKSNITDLFNSANTWSGQNTFSNHMYIYGQWKGLYFQNPEATAGVAPSGDKRNYISFLDANGYNLGDIVLNVIGANSTWFQIGVFAKDVNDSSQSIYCGTQYRVYGNGEKYFNPSTNGDVHLGTSTHRWKTFNGINPGALSLPSGATENINTDNWNFSWSTNTVTAPFDGYIAIACFGSALQINDETKAYAMTYAPGSDGFICGLLPVSSGDSIKVLVTRTQTSIYEGYKFIKASGNVS